MAKIIENKNPTQLKPTFDEKFVNVFLVVAFDQHMSLNLVHLRVDVLFFVFIFNYALFDVSSQVSFELLENQKQQKN